MRWWKQHLPHPEARPEGASKDGQRAARRWIPRVRRCGIRRRLAASPPCPLAPGERVRVRGSRAKVVPAATPHRPAGHPLPRGARVYLGMARHVHDVIPAKAGIQQQGRDLPTSWPGLTRPRDDVPHSHASRAIRVVPGGLGLFPRLCFSMLPARWGAVQVPAAKGWMQRTGLRRMEIRLSFGRAPILKKQNHGPDWPCKCDAAAETRQTLQRVMFHYKDITFKADGRP